MTTSPLTSLTETVSDALSSSASVVHDLAETAAELATDVAAAAKDRIGPAPRRSGVPWMFVAAGIVALIVVAFLLRRRASNGPSVDVAVDGRPNPLRAETTRAVTAAGGN